jgi:hypothetical protein
MPPSDGNGVGSGEELVAQVIPLRRRGEPPAQILTDEPPGWFEPLDELLGPSERSVWEQPTVELRRRTPEPSEPHNGRLAGVGARVRERPGRFLAGGAAAVAGIAIAVAVGLSVGVFSGREGTLPPRGISASLQVGQAAGLTAHESRHSPPSLHTSTRRRRTAASQAHASTRPHELTTRSGNNTPASAQEQTAGSQAPNTASVGQQQPVADSTPASTGSSPAVSEGAQYTSAERQFGFEHH